VRTWQAAVASRATRAGRRRRAKARDLATERRTLHTPAPRTRTGPPAGGPVTASRQIRCRRVVNHPPPRAPWAAA
jgi:hypothetical protein